MLDILEKGRNVRQPTLGRVMQDPEGILFELDVFVAVLHCIHNFPVLCYLLVVLKDILFDLHVYGHVLLAQRPEPLVMLQTHVHHLLDGGLFHAKSPRPQTSCFGQSDAISDGRKQIILVEVLYVES